MRNQTTMKMVKLREYFDGFLAANLKIRVNVFGVRFPSVTSYRVCVAVDHELKSKASEVDDRRS